MLGADRCRSRNVDQREERSRWTNDPLSRLQSRERFSPLFLQPSSASFGYEPSIPAGGHPFDTGGGKIIAMAGASAPMRVAITDWDSLEQGRHSTSQRPGTTKRHSVTRLLRPYGDTPSKPCPRVRPSGAGCSTGARNLNKQLHLPRPPTGGL
jgi:hypothetical protein